MHKPLRYDDRKSSSERGYGSRWRKARESFLRKNPFCSAHKKNSQLIEATVVDHIKPHRGNNDLFWDKNNWQALCATCHSSWKQRLEKSGVDSGCDEGGMPVDLNHHWNKK